ncbi:thiol-disulfide oxidoreductase [Salinivirga cyanobacteriivorans]|uniref:Thiol-disulfide oxidoreductase n=1 Tax=Salinivirga cyanobacteriivorans TaxID=1307839 RepID=A0A0S2I3T3_9BACT|nr:thioredoxin family protein [Salinivirga cyanobacteriivorans]ALO16998.1 thiol-disulfide oxidoreductase [Salinivirga cyanobacteriivorans]
MRTLLFVISIFISTALMADGFQIGDKVDNFNLKNIDGKMVSLDEMQDVKGAIVIFTCNHCPYSIANEDRIIELDKKYKKKGYPVIAINPNDPKIQPEDSFDKMKVRAKEKGFTFPYLFDEEQTVYKKFGATKTPHVFVLNKKGNEFVLEYIGAIDDSPRKAEKVNDKYVEKAVDALLAGNEPPMRETKAIGCSIKD